MKKNPLSIKQTFIVRNQAAINLKPKAQQTVVRMFSEPQKLSGFGIPQKGRATKNQSSHQNNGLDLNVKSHSLSLRSQDSWLQQQYSGQTLADYSGAVLIFKLRAKDFEDYSSSALASPQKQSKVSTSEELSTCRVSKTLNPVESLTGTILSLDYIIDNERPAQLLQSAKNHKSSTVENIRKELKRLAFHVQQC